MAIDDPIDFLFSLERLGMKFGLENISALCQSLGHPERSFAPVLIAGTNGKGSVTVMVDAALRAAGHRTARYTSPHLVRLEERFVIGGAEVATDTLRVALGRVQAATARLLAAGILGAPPTFFEVTTAAAFELFRDADVEIGVLEVGLGGRLDATNVVRPVATAITSIDFDHQAQLGTTIESIAREKGGIIKPGVPVVCGPLPPEAARVIGSICEDQGAPMIQASERVDMTAHADGTIDIRTRHRSLPGITLALEGAHQRHNAAVAVALLEELSRGGFAAPDAAIRDALTHVRWPGRLEHFTVGGTAVLIDAAHNPAGATALAAYLEEHGWRDATLVFGAMADKDVRGMLEALLRPAHVWGRLVCTTASNARALAAPALAAVAVEIAARGIPVEAVEDPAVALDRALALARPVVVAGSIFLIGPLRDILR